MARRNELSRIMVVEDDPQIRDFASKVLQLEGYQVLQAGDVNSALRLVRRQPVSLILLDLQLPERDGWSMLAEMKREPALAAIPVIVFTASAGMPSQDKAFDMGVECYLVKPVSAARLRETVARILTAKETPHATQERVNTAG